ATVAHAQRGRLPRMGRRRHGLRRHRFVKAWQDCDGLFRVDAMGRPYWCEENPCDEEIEKDIEFCAGDAGIQWLVPAAADGYYEVTIDGLGGACAANNGTYIVPLTFFGWRSCTKTFAAQDMRIIVNAIDTAQCMSR